MRTIRSVTPVDANLDAYHSILNADGDPILSVHIAHPHKHVFAHYGSRETGDYSTLAVQLDKNTKIATFTSAALFSLGDIVDIQSGTEHVHHYRGITAVSDDVITFDALTDIDFAIGSTVAKASINMAVDGSVAPVIFEIPVKSSEFLHLETLTITSTHTDAGDDEKFCGMDALDSGLHVRVNRNNGEAYETVAIWKTNQQMRADMGNAFAYLPAAPSGLDSTIGSYNFFEKSGAIELLQGSNNDVLEFIVQDDLTDLNSLLIKVHGH